MNTPYKLSNGKTVDIEVNLAVDTALTDLDRQASNEARKYRRRHEASIEAMREETGWEPTDTRVDIEAEYIKKEETAELMAAISRLSPKQQRLIRLYYYEGKTMREIADIFGLNSSSISGQLDTIKKMLKKYLEKF